MRKGAPADRGPMIPKYKNPSSRSRGCSPAMPSMTGGRGKFSKGAALKAYAHSRKGRK